MKHTALAAVLVALSFTSAPALASEGHRRITCKQALRSSLRDPRSLDIPWGGIVSGNDVVRIDYRAKNGFGGINSAQFYCEFQGTKLIRIVNN